MATANKRIGIEVAVETTGDKDLDRLLKALRDAGQDVAPFEQAARRLGGELQALQQQQGLIAEFTQLKQASVTAADGLDQAQKKAQQLGRELAQTAEPTQQQKINFEQAKTAVNDAKQAYQEIATQLGQSRAAMAQAGIQTEGLSKQQAELNKSAKETKAGLNEIKESLQQLPPATKATADAMQAVAAATQQKTNAIKQGLALEQSEIDLQRQTLALEKEQQQALLRSAQARGDEAAAMQANNRLAAIEADSAELTARAKRTQAAAIEATVAARREELAAAGPLTQAQTQELQASDNLARSLRAQADASVLATKNTREHAEAVREAAEKEKAVAEATQQAAAAAKEAAAEEVRLANLVAETKARLAAQAKAEADGIIADYVRMEKAQREAAQAAQKAAQDTANAMQNAFGTVGVRSAEAIRAEIQRVRDAMQLLSASGKVTGNELAIAMKSGEQAIAGLERELRQVTGTMTTADKAAGLLKNAVGQITAGNVAANAIGYLTGKVQQLGGEFVQAVMQGEKMRLALTAIYKDAGVAASQIKFLKETTNAAGVSYGDLSRDFIKFSATMNGANIPLKQSNDLFSALTRAAGALGMSSDEVSGALNALGQMASKGVVSMEELRQQLGERLPGAMSLVAKGFGISEKALIDLVSSGNLAAYELFPALTSALQKMAAETDALSGAWERLKNLLKGASQDLGDAGWAIILTGALKILGTTLGLVVSAVQGLYEGLRMVVVISTSLFGAFDGVLDGLIKQLHSGKVSTSEFAQSISFELGNAFGFVNEEAEKTRDRLANTTGAIGSLWGITDKAAQAQREYAEAIGGGTNALTQNTAAASASTAQLGTLAESAVKSAEGVSGLERVTQLQALAVKLAGDNTLAATSKLVQFNAAADAMLKQQEIMSESVAKVAKGVKDQGDALMTLISLRGNEQATLVAVATATANYEAALNKVTASKQTELEILQMQLVMREQEMVRAGQTAEKIKELTAAIRGKITTSEAEVEQAKGAAAEARQGALAQELAAKAYADNSAKVAEYSKALEQARKELQWLQDMHKKGIVTDAELQAGQEKVTRAQYLYNDSLKDSVTKQQAYGEAKKSVYALETAGLNLSLKQAEASERMARLMGKESEAREAARKQREIEIKLIETKVKSLQAEADSMEATARAQQKELEAKGELTEVNQIHISNALRAAEAKREEAKATEAGIAVMKKEADQLGVSTEAYIKKAEAIKRKNAAAQADSDLVKSGLELRKSEIEASIAIAEAQGKESQVIKLKIEQKRIEIQIIQEAVKAQIADAEASIGVAEAKMSELRATGSLTAEKRAELENQIKSAQAKINDAKARSESVRVLEQEIKGLQGSTNGYNSNASAINNATTALEAHNKEKEREIAAQEKANELKQREIDLYNKKWKMDADHNSVDANGNRIQQTMDNVTSLTNKGIDAGLTATQATALANKYKPNEKTGMYDANAFWKELNEIKIKAATDADRIAELQKKADAGTLSGSDLFYAKELGIKLPPPAPPPDPVPTPTPAPAPKPPTPAPAPTPVPAPRQQSDGNGSSSSMAVTPAPTYISNINLPGIGTAQVKFDNPNDQAQLKNILGALTSAAGVAQ